MLNYYFPGEPFSMGLHLVFSTGLVVGAMALSLITCDLGVIFELVGATSACAMAYILPPLCYIKLTTRSWKTYAAMAVVAFGCVVMVISVLQAVGKIIRGTYYLFVRSASEPLLARLCFALLCFALLCCALLFRLGLSENGLLIRVFLPCLRRGRVSSVCLASTGL